MYFNIFKEWGLEGYQLWMVCKNRKEVQHADYNDNTECSHVMQIHFVKSALTVNPCSVRFGLSISVISF